MLIKIFLLSYVSADLFFIEPHRTHTVPTGPEMHSRETPFMPQQFPVDSDRTLPFQKPDHHRNAVPWRNAQTQVDMINYRFPFHQLHSSLPAQVPQNRPDPTSYPSEQYLVTILWYKHYMILAFPSDVGHALPILHWLSFAPWEDLPKRESLYNISRTFSRALSCLTARGGGLLKWN